MYHSDRCFIKYHQIDSSCVSALCVLFRSVARLSIQSLSIDHKLFCFFFLACVCFFFHEHCVLLLRNSASVIFNKATPDFLVGMCALWIVDDRKKRAIQNIRKYMSQDGRHSFTDVYLANLSAKSVDRLISD